MTIKARTLYAGLVPALIVPFLASFFYFIIFCDTPIGSYLYAATKLFTVFWPIFCLVFIFRTKLPRVPLDRLLPNRDTLILGILTGLCMAAFLFMAMKTGLWWMVASHSPAIRTKVMQFGISGHYWTFALFLSIIHSIIEEYYWRWFVYGFLRLRLSFLPSALIASAAFSSHHIVILSQFFPLPWAFVFGSAVCFGGVVWCRLYERQHTIMGAWISHGILDLALMYIGYRLIFI